MDINITHEYTVYRDLLTCYGSANSNSMAGLRNMIEMQWHRLSDQEKGFAKVIELKYGYERRG